MNKDITPREARHMLWRKGVLHWKFHKTQKEIYDFISTTQDKIVVISSARRLGKTYCLCVIAIEACLKKENTIVKFLSPEAKMIRRILKPIVREIIRDCPQEMRPVYNSQENIWKFANGSEIQLAGTDQGNAESLRGGGSHICIVDEAGFCSDLKYVVNSILLPTTTTTRGKIILISTPPKSPDHEFVDFIKDAEARGAFIKKTIYDNPMVTEEIIEGFAQALGGKESVDFRREYLAELIKSDEDSIIPEFDEILKKKLVVPNVRPAYYDGYVAMDIGLKDLTVVLFAYYDFRKAKLVIEDELVMNGKKMTTDYLAESIKEKEKSIYVHAITKEFMKPYLRVSDNNLIVINDLQQLHGLTFLPTAKENAEGALNEVRIMLRQERVLINPRCMTLIRHLEHGVWNKARTSYDRSADYGHYDAIDALKYLIRNLQQHKNPFPANFGFNTGDEVYIDQNYKPQNPMHSSFERMFQPKKVGIKKN